MQPHKKLVFTSNIRPKLRLGKSPKRPIAINFSHWCDRANYAVVKACINI
ncbi:hypothetical protein [Microcoleus sp. EPA2]